MKQRSVKQLKSKLIEQQATRKYKDLPELPAKINGELVTITRIHTPATARTALPTIEHLPITIQQEEEKAKKEQLIVKAVTDHKKWLLYPPEPCMPGFNHF